MLMEEQQVSNGSTAEHPLLSYLVALCVLPYNLFFGSLTVETFHVRAGLEHDCYGRTLEREKGKPSISVRSSTINPNSFSLRYSYCAPHLY